MEIKLLVQIVTGCSGWHLLSFAFCNLIGTTALLLQFWSILTVTLNKLEAEEICVIVNERGRWYLHFLCVRDYGFYLAQLFSHLEVVRLQLLGQRLAPSYYALCGGKSQHLCCHLILCTAKNCRYVEQTGVRSSMSQCLLGCWRSGFNSCSNSNSLGVVSGGINVRIETFWQK